MATTLVTQVVIDLGKLFIVTAPSGSIAIAVDDQRKLDGALAGQVGGHAMKTVRTDLCTNVVVDKIPSLVHCRGTVTE